MGYFDLRWKPLVIHRESMVLRRDLHPAGHEIPHRLVGSAMAEFHLECGTSEGLAEQLMAEADAKNGAPSDELRHLG